MASTARFWCHSCEREVRILRQADGDIECSSCKGCFVEELEETADLSSDGKAQGLSATGQQPLGERNAVPSSSSGGGGGVAVQSTPGGLQGFSASFGNGNIHFQMFNGFGGAAGGTRPPPLTRVIGDIFSSARRIFEGNMGGGRSFQDILHNLMMNDPNRHGSPPASKAAVASLREVKVDSDLVKSRGCACAVCQDDFKTGQVLKQLPCDHYFHPNCILPWLKLHNSCPTCRHELPTDDAAYERRRQQRQQQQRQQQQQQQQQQQRQQTAPNGPNTSAGQTRNEN